MVGVVGEMFRGVLGEESAPPTMWKMEEEDVEADDAVVDGEAVPSIIDDDDDDGGGVDRLNEPNRSFFIDFCGYFVFCFALLLF